MKIFRITTHRGVCIGITAMSAKDAVKKYNSELLAKYGRAVRAELVYQSVSKQC